MTLESIIGAMGLPNFWDGWNDSGKCVYQISRTPGWSWKFKLASSPE